MNLKLNNEVQSLVRSEPLTGRSAIKEERRRTGRYIAILVGISLLFLALYQAWVRKIPVLASLIVPALIMFIYIAWVLYTASRDKRNRARDLERAMEENLSPLSLTPPLDPVEEQPASKIDTYIQLNNCTIPVNIEKIPSFKNITFDVKYCIITNDSSKQEEESKNTYCNVNEHISQTKGSPVHVKPTILVNDEPPVDTDEQIGENTEAGVENYKHEKLKIEYPHTVFRRSYSIA